MLLYGSHRMITESETTETKGHECDYSQFKIQKKGVLGFWGGPITKDWHEVAHISRVTVGIANQKSLLQ